MNLKAIYEKVAELVPKGHVSVQLEIVRYGSDPETPVVQLNIYDGAEWFTGGLEGAALAGLQAKHQTREAADLSRLTDVQLPEAKGATE